MCLQILINEPVFYIKILIMSVLLRVFIWWKLCILWKLRKSKVFTTLFFPQLLKYIFIRRFINYFVVTSNLKEISSLREDLIKIYIKENT